MRVSELEDDLDDEEKRRERAERSREVAQLSDRELRDRIRDLEREVSDAKYEKQRADAQLADRVSENTRLQAKLKTLGAAHIASAQAIVNS